MLRETSRSMKTLDRTGSRSTTWKVSYIASTIFKLTNYLFNIIVAFGCASVAKKQRTLDTADPREPPTFQPFAIKILWYKETDLSRLCRSTECFDVSLNLIRAQSKEQWDGGEICCDVRKEFGGGKQIGYWDHRADQEGHRSDLAWVWPLSV